VFSFLRILSFLLRKTRKAGLYLPIFRVLLQIEKCLTGAEAEAKRGTARA